MVPATHLGSANRFGDLLAFSFASLMNPPKKITARNSRRRELHTIHNTLPTSYATMVLFLHPLLLIATIAIEPVDGFSSSSFPPSYSLLGSFVRRRKTSTYLGEVALNSSESWQQQHSTSSTSSSSTLNNNDDNSSTSALSSLSSSSVAGVIDYSHMTILPRHPSNNEANAILTRAELALQTMQSQIIHDAQVNEQTVPNPLNSGFDVDLYDIEQEAVYANSYVDMGDVDTVGFDYDYTLVTYTETLLELIYDMALRRLVEDKEYPREMLEVGLKFDPSFSIRGRCSVVHGNEEDGGKERTKKNYLSIPSGLMLFVFV